MTDHTLALAVVILATAVLVLVVMTALARRDADRQTEIAERRLERLRELREELRYAETGQARLAAQLAATQAQLIYPDAQPEDLLAHEWQVFDQLTHTAFVEED